MINIWNQQKILFRLMFVIIVTWGGGMSLAGAAEVVMYKNANCGCCGAWATHMRDAGFTVKEIAKEDMSAIKAIYGIPNHLVSCHTVIVDGYVIEGHVPASDVLRLLKDKPRFVGLTAPGMPMQSPGMQAKGKAPKNYDVIAFDKHGNMQIFHRY